jgi:AMP phosphorylase
VIEALRVLEGAAEPNSFIQKGISIAGIALEMSGKAARGTGAAMAHDILLKGKALSKFKEIIEIQGGDPNVKSTDIVPGEHQFVVNAPASGYVIEMNNKSLISLARTAGAPHDRGPVSYSMQKKANSSRRANLCLLSMLTGTGGCSRLLKKAGASCRYWLKACSLTGCHQQARCRPMS